MQAEFILKREYQDDAYYVEYYPEVIEPNFHSPIEMWIMLEGSAEVWINGRRELLRKGEIIVAFSYDTHACRVLEKGSRMGTLILPLSCCGEFREEIKEKRAMDTVIRDEAVFETVHKSLLQMVKKDRSEMTRKGHLYVAFGMILDHLSMEARSEKVDLQLSARLMEYMQENFRREISLQSAASALGYHPGYISRYFKENFHISFGRYLTLLRLRESVLLMQAGKGLSDCAFESGFGSLTTFHRCFQKEFQCTPKQYMKK